MLYVCIFLFQSYRCYVCTDMLEHINIWRWLVAVFLRQTSEEVVGRVPIFSKKQKHGRRFNQRWHAPRLGLGAGQALNCQAFPHRVSRHFNARGSQSQAALHVPSTPMRGIPMPCIPMPGVPMSTQDLAHALGLWPPTRGITNKFNRLALKPFQRDERKNKQYYIYGWNDVFGYALDRNLTPA